MKSICHTSCGKYHHGIKQTGHCGREKGPLEGGPSHKSIHLSTQWGGGRFFRLCFFKGEKLCPIQRHQASMMIAEVVSLHGNRDLLANYH